MAIYCNHMSVHLVTSDDNFEIYGPVIMNAEVIAYNSEEVEKISRLGIGQKKKHLYDYALGSYSYIDEIVEMSPHALPYSLETGQVDGIALDISNATILPESTNFIPFSNDDYISYALVVRKDIVETDAFKEFIDIYNKVVNDLNQKDKLREFVGGSDKLWNVVNIKYLSLQEGR